MSDNGPTQAANAPRVTIVVSARERFGMATRSLESIYAASDIPFDLVYVDARSPGRISDWLTTEARIKGFRHVRLGRFATPNEARNLGLAQANTEFVVFIDNDVICADGWLGALVACADETGADVVAPLVCEGLPLHSRIHQATGTPFTGKAADFFATPRGQRELTDLMVHYGVPIAEVRSQLLRAETDAVEFHCVLARRSLFDRIGPLDEELYATKEHIDFCMCVLKAGGKIMFEPDSVVTYVYPSSTHPLTPEDRSWFLLRWSPQWQIHSLDHLQEKWGLKDGPYLNEIRKNHYLRQRHYEGLLKPLLKKVPLVAGNSLLLRLGRKLLKYYFDPQTRALAAEYEQQRVPRRPQSTIARDGT